MHTTSRSLLLLAVLAAAPSGHLRAATDAPLTPPVHLPDGTEFRTWEVPPVFSRSYHVDQHHPTASDRNPGTAERPFLTINHATQVVQAGERVVVASGVYRERVAPARGGSGPERLISYEAAPGSEVVISGSKPVRSAWARSR